MTPVIIGELNPYGADPAMAMYPLPESSSGGRMQRLVCGVRRGRYIDFPRHNLCVGRFTQAAARARAHELLETYAAEPGKFVLVLLGRAVSSAFFRGLAPPDPFTRRTLVAASVSPLLGVEFGRNVVVLPHPSGLNRDWQKPAAFGLAQEILREAMPGIPWGSGT